MEGANGVESSSNICTKIESEEKSKPQSASASSPRQAKKSTGDASSKKHPEKQEKQQRQIAKSKNKGKDQLDDGSRKVVKQIKLKENSNESVVKPRLPKRKVDLFSHLVQPEEGRILTEHFTMGRHNQVPEPIIQLGVQIAAGTVSGSGERCVLLLTTLKEVFKTYYTTPSNELPQRHMITFLNPCVDFLVQCRPLCHTMSYAIRHIKRIISEKMPPDTGKDEAVEFICEKIDKFLEDRINIAHESISRDVCKKIADGDVILIFGSSALIARVLYVAFVELKKDISVIVVDSRPYFPGKSQVKRLASFGIPCDYALLSSISYTMRAATKVLLSAHSMMSNGNLVNSAGTAQVAIAASFSNVPVIVCCEAFKFSPDAQTDAFVHNELGNPDDLLKLQPGVVSPLKNWDDIPDIKLLNLGRDVTPARYIDVLVTDYGFVPPFSSAAVLRKSESKFDVL
eukprot:gene6574-9397_t